LYLVCLLRFESFVFRNCAEFKWIHVVHGSGFESGAVQKTFEDSANYHLQGGAVKRRHLKDWLERNLIGTASCQRERSRASSLTIFNELTQVTFALFYDRFELFDTVEHISY
jgi:hypothetical protein